MKVAVTRFTARYHSHKEAQEPQKEIGYWFSLGLALLGVRCLGTALAKRRQVGALQGIAQFNERGSYVRVRVIDPCVDEGAQEFFVGVDLCVLSPTYNSRPDTTCRDFGQRE